MAYAITAFVAFWIGFALCAIMANSSRMSREEDARMRRRAGRVFMRDEEVGDAGPLE